MKKAQFLKFCQTVADSTGVKEAISSCENKKGYAGRRTLERLCQAVSGFKEGLPSDVIAKRTGWSLKYVEKIRGWWQEAFPNEADRVTLSSKTVVSWSMKEVIGDLASKVGPNPEAIIIDLARLCGKGKRLEGELPPDPGTVVEIIKEMQKRYDGIRLEEKRRFDKMIDDMKNI